MAKKLNLELSGTLGTLLKAKQKGIISAINPYINQLKQINYRISDDLVEEILERAKERT